jgi:hypothetical protein
MVLVVACCFANAAAAHDVSTSDRSWENGARPFWQVDVGYPLRASVGVTVVAGQERRLNNFASQHRGLLLAIDAGLTGLSAKAGWAQLRPYDAGMSGYSAELVVVRPIGLDSGFDRGQTYVGGEMSYYWLIFKFSGGALLTREVNATKVVPIATAALVVPFGS